jgi:amidase
MLSRNDWRAHDALGLARLVAERQVTARELVERAIAEIEERNGALNAVVYRRFDEALAEARSASASGPLAGVPYLVKNLHLPVRGLPLTHGSRLFAGNVPQFDATLAARLRKAGLLLLGRTSSPEFGLNYVTEPAAYGAARNPWHTGHSPGGSSGGAAAAVASGMLPAAHATDSGGSIRIPASCCGLVGLKPTRGVNPAGPHRADGAHGIGHEHAVTMTVRDCAALLDATAGRAPGDPYCTATPPDGYLAAIATPPARLRIAVLDRAFDGTAVDAEVRHGALRAASLLQELGHAVEEAAPDFDAQALQRAVFAVLFAGLAHLVDSRARELGRPLAAEDLEDVTRQAVEAGRAMSVPDYLGALATINREVRRLGAFFERYDILLTPTIAVPPPPVGSVPTMGTTLERHLESFYRDIPFTVPFNASGQPAISLPLHRTAAGLPVGVQLAAGFGEDALLLSLAAEIEAASPWPWRPQP